MIVERDKTTIPAVGGRTDQCGPRRARPKRRRNWAWLGLVPFFAFIFLFLLVPAISVFSEAFEEQGRQVRLRLDARGVPRAEPRGVQVLREVLRRRCRGRRRGRNPARLRRARPPSDRSGCAAWSPRSVASPPTSAACRSRSRSSHCSGRQGLLTKIIKALGWDLYASGFGLGEVPGLIAVYSYFNIPLMVLITLPAIDGLKASWREASSTSAARRSPTGAGSACPS